MGGSFAATMYAVTISTNMVDGFFNDTLHYLLEFLKT